MRLDRLRIPNYRNLQSFEIDFDASESTTVLMGRNGSGKSNLIEAIVEIFRELEIGKAPSFAFEMDYVCQSHEIRIDADPSRSRRRLDITVDGEQVAVTAFRKNLENYLPNYVFAYYSGWSSRLERHFDGPTRKHYDAILKADDNKLPLRRMFFCRKEYSQLVLLAFFLSPNPAAKRLLGHYLGIRRFESALFVLKSPWWRGSGAPRRDQMDEGDARFWYARGAFRGFLNRMWECTLAPIRNTEAVERDIRRKAETTERLYMFVKNETELSKLKGTSDTPKDLFGYLESLFLCDLIDEVRVTVERTDGSCLNFTQMSEGEQQLLTVLGLLLFTQNDESLYLLDEPDTHLNPVWTYDYLDLLQQNILAEKGQLIVSTHNPLMIGSLRKNQVRILTAEGSATSAVEPDYDPLGIGVEGLLKSELYGLRSTLAPEVLTLIDRHYELLGIEERSDEQGKELMKLASDLNALGVSRSHPNPYFEAFAGALARRGQSKGVTSKEDQEAQVTLADAVLREILDEERLEVAVEPE